MDEATMKRVGAATPDIVGIPALQPEVAINADRILTIHFIDGSKLSFDFEEQGPNAAAKQLKLQDFLAGKHLIIDSDGWLLIFPVTSIKYLALRGSAGAFWKEATLPKGAIRGARVRD